MRSQIVWSPSVSDHFIVFSDEMTLYRAETFHADAHSSAAVPTSTLYCALQLAVNADLEAVRCFAWHHRPEFEFLVAVGHANGQVRYECVSEKLLWMIRWKISLRNLYFIASRAHSLSIPIRQAFWEKIFLANTAELAIAYRGTHIPINCLRSGLTNIERNHRWQYGTFSHTVYQGISHCFFSRQQKILCIVVADQ